MGKKLTVGILISGGGTTAEAVIKASKRRKLKDVDFVVISSNPTATGNKRVKKLGIKPYIIDREKYKTHQAFGKDLLALLKKLHVDVISLQGWLPLIPENVIDAYKNKIINQHPGPLDPGRPDFGGKGMSTPYRVNCAKIAYSWVTGQDPWTESVVHFVTKNFDQGDLIRVAKMRLPLTKKKVTIEDLEKNPEKLIKTTYRIQKRFYPIEHKNVIETIKHFTNGGVSTYIRTKPLVPSQHLRVLEESKNLAMKLFPPHNL